MTQFTPDHENGHGYSTDTQLERRTERALSEPLSVVSLDGTPIDNINETVVQVVSHSGESYHVDAEVGRCECPDHRHRDVECKHIRRARIALGLSPVSTKILAAVNVDDQLGANTPGPVVVTTDGGVVDTSGENLEDTDDGRPDDCECAEWNNDSDIPCWPCYREGFDEPANTKE